VPQDVSGKLTVLGVFEGWPLAVISTPTEVQLPKEPQR